MLRLCPSGRRDTNLHRARPGASVPLCYRCVYFVRRQETTVPGPCPSVIHVPNYLLFSNLPRAVSTLVQIARPTHCVPGQVQDSCRAHVTVNVLTPILNWVWRCRHLHIRCLRSTAPALAVPCSPLPMVTSVSQIAAYQVCSDPASMCLVDHVLHGICPDVMTLGIQRRAVAYYSRGGMTSTNTSIRCCEARCLHPPWGQVCPQLGPLTGSDPWGSTLLEGVTIYLSVLRMSVCVSLHSRAWLPRTGFADVGPKFLIRYYYHTYGAQFLCWCLSFGKDGKSPTY